MTYISWSHLHVNIFCEPERQALIRQLHCLLTTLAFVFLVTNRSEIYVLLFQCYQHRKLCQVFAFSSALWKCIEGKTPHSTELLFPETYTVRIQLFKTNDVVG